MAAGSRRAMRLRGELGDTGYSLPAGLTFDEWVAEGPTLATMARSAMWWLADWLIYGERTFGSDRVYAVLEEATGLSYTTLRNYHWVAERIPPAERRPELEFSHHRAVAALEPTQRNELLDKAAERGMTEGELRGRVKQIRGGDDPPPEVEPEPDETLTEAAGHVVKALVQAEAARNWDAVKAATGRLERALRNERVPA